MLSEWLAENFSNQSQIKEFAKMLSNCWGREPKEMRIYYKDLL